MSFRDYISEMALPKDWDTEALSPNATFKSKLKYATERAKKLGSGSSRVAFIIEHEGRETVLKVAKNAKGVAQNEVEIDVFDDGYFGNHPIIIPVIDWDKSSKPQWIQTEKADKLTPTAFKKYFGTDPHTLVEWVDYRMGSKKYKRMPYMYNDVKNLELDNEHADDFADFCIARGDEAIYDYARLANWGEWNGTPVLIDIGLTTALFEDHYMRK